MSQNSKKQLLKSILIISVLLAVLFVLKMNFILMGLGSIASLFGKLLTCNIKTFEAFLLGSVPILTYWVWPKSRLISGSLLFKASLVSYLLVFLFFFLGVIFCVYFTSSPSPLLPDYIAFQPFQFYWGTLLFIAIGVHYFILKYTIKFEDKAILDS